MSPTLFGRIQTRILLSLFVGVPLALVLGVLLPRPRPSMTLGDMFQVFLAAIAIVAVVGIVWEFVYHGLQQFRWEKDWPTLFGLITGVPEGIVVYLLLNAGVPWDFGSVPLKTFLPMFFVVWVCTWMIANGPLQIVLLRWRYQGGRVL